MQVLSADITVCSIWVSWDSECSASAKRFSWTTPSEVSAVLCVGVCCMTIWYPLDTEHNEQNHLCLKLYLPSYDLSYECGILKHPRFSVVHCTVDNIYLPTLHFVFCPQSPMLSNHERLTPTPQSNSHSSKVTLLDWRLSPALICWYFLTISLVQINIHLKVKCMRSYRVSS